MLRRAVELHLAGREAEAVPLYDDVVAARPKNWRALYNRGIALATLGRVAEAAASYRQALAAKPDHADAYLNLAGLIEAAGQRADAAALLRQGAGLCPGHAPIWNNLGKMLMDSGDAEGAAEAYLRAVTLDATLIPAHMGLGNAHFALHRVNDALACFQRILALQPSHASAMSSMGAMIRALGRVEEARQWFLRAIAADPNDPDAHNNLGLVLRQQGAFAEAIASFRRALALDPGKVYAHDNLLFCLQFDPAVTPQAMLAEARLWNNFVAGVAPLPPAPRSWEPERRLKVGYVSPDFREHACCYYLEPLIRAHDRAAVEVFCYAEVPLPDAVTARIRAGADHWRSSVGLSDAELAAAIRADGIDILVDCAGHTGGSRLVTFAYRPAPVQVATLIGYSATTGVAAFDYLLGDPYLTPEGCDADFSEPIVRLPDGIAPFLPRAHWPEVGPAPADGPVVFGSVADPARLDRRTVALWRRLLERVPESRVLAKHGLFDDASARDAWRRRLGDIAGRVDLEGTPGGWGKNMDVYSRFSVVLDSPLHSGNTSVLIPLWMGVPVVTLAGANAWQRAGASILSHAGLPDLVAGDDDRYVDIAARLAADRPRLSRLRRELRAMMLNSPVCDARRAVGGIEAAYRRMWRRAVAAHDGSRT